MSSLKLRLHSKKYPSEKGKNIVNAVIKNLMISEKVNEITLLKLKSFGQILDYYRKFSMI